MRRKKNDTISAVEKATMDALYTAVQKAEDTKSTIQFTKALLTESEQLMIGRRLLIAHMLLQGLPQTQIRYELRVSSSTVWRVNTWLANQIPEYGQALEKIRVESSKNTAALKDKGSKYAYAHYDPLTFKGLRKKYPMHFILFTIAEEIYKTSKQ